MISGSILLLYQFQTTWSGFVISNLLFFVEAYNHYFTLTKYVVNEYYMAAILHYMSYESVRGDPELAIVRFK